MKLDASLRACLLASVTAFSMLAAQVLVHRLISLKLLGNYAFFVISLTMMGLGLSGVVLTRLLRRIEKAPGDWLAAAAAAFSVTLVGAPAILLRTDTQLVPTTRTEFVIAFLKTMPSALIFAIPFTFGGLILGYLLSSPRFPARRVYFFDLVGSAAGACAILPVLTWIGVERAVTVVALLELVAVFVLMPAKARWAQGLLVFAASLAILAGVRTDVFFALRDHTHYDASPTRDRHSTATLIHSGWDPLGRAELWRMDGAPPWFFLQGLFGDNPKYRQRFQRVLTQNNWAYTYAPHYDGTPESLDGLERTLYAVSYRATSVAHPRVAVIGVGGGSDILAALRFGSPDVTGIEANGATFDVYKNVDRAYFGPWADDPRVHLVHDEGRHFLSAKKDKYDVIQLSGVDTYSGTPGAAHVFTENYLYTVEAFQLYLSRLTDQGIFNVARVEWPPPRELLRALTTAVLALRRSGVEHPAQHIVVIASKERLLLMALVKKTPFTDAELDQLERAAEDNPQIQIQAGPRWNGMRRNVHQAFLSLEDESAEHAFLDSAPVDVHPVEDDRPFYFRFSYWSDVVRSPPGLEHLIPVMEYSVLLLFGVVAVVTIVCLYLPLRLLRTRHEKPTRHRGRMGLYFAALGVGFMGIELSLLQSFGLFLGHPNYALSVVLAALLFSGGVGSLVAERLVAKLRGVRFVAYLFVAIMLVEHLLLIPRLGSLAEAGFALRCLVTVVLILPVGICLGVFLPSGIESLKTRAPDLVPWAWGVNGMFSVLGPLFAIAFSITFGVSALLLVSLPIYLAAGWLFVPPATAVGATTDPGIST